jgi:tetratricopeptide (TPR) repeat protein
MSTAGQTARPESASWPTIGFVIVLVFVIGGLWSLDLFLARTDREAVQNQANNLYTQGVELLQQGHAGEAVERLRRANSLVRDNRGYQLDYVAALMAARKFDEAETNLKTLLDADPNNGRANLLSARLKVQQGKLPDAESYYHRAIYGSWPETAAAHRVAARLELADLLAKRGDQEELLAEVVALEAEAQNNAAILKQVANLYRVAGSPAREANVYRELIESNQDDFNAYVGLGEAEMAVGDYHDAMAAFLDANRRSLGDRTVQEDIALLNAMASIDPTPRRLSSAEKFARSTQILRLTRDALNGCAKTQESQRMVDNCDKVLAENVPPHVTNEMSEARLTLAEQLWQARIQLCGASSSEQEHALRLIMTKLAHS